MLLDAILGIGFAPIIRSIVTYIKPSWEKFETLVPVINTTVSCLLGVAVSFGWQAYQPTGQGIAATVSIGFLSGLASIIYNDFRVAKIEGPDSGIDLVPAKDGKSSAPRGRRTARKKRGKSSPKVGSVTPQK